MEGWRRTGAYVLCRDVDERVLLTRFRWPGHPDDGGWTARGGSMEWGESPEETARRELFEETGLSAELGPILGVYSSWYTAEESVRGTPGQHVGVVYRGHRLRGTLRLHFDEGTTDRAEWFTLEEARGLPLGRPGSYLLDLGEHAQGGLLLPHSCRSSPPAACRGATRPVALVRVDGYRRVMPNFAAIALQRMQAIVSRLPDVEQSDNPPGCYFLVRRKIFAQVATVIDQGQPVTMVALRPDPGERDALLSVGHPYISRGRWDDRLGRIAVLIDAETAWDEVAELVTDSYRLTAPKKLTAQLDAG